MPLSLSWADPDHVSKLLRQLAGREPAGSVAPRARASMPAIPRPPSRPAREHPIPRELVSSVPPAPATPTIASTRVSIAPFAATDVSIEARLDAMVAWLVEMPGVSAAFIVDENGLAVAERGASLEHMAASSLLLDAAANARRATNSPFGFISVHLDDGSVLHLVQADTSLGQFATGLLASKDFPEPPLTLVRRALIETMGASDGR